LISLEMSLATARKIRRNPRLMRVPRVNLKRWRKANRGLGGFHREWERILDNNAWQRVLEIFTQDSDDGQRLRQGDPFVGILSEKECLQFLRTDERFRRKLATSIVRRLSRQNSPSYTSMIMAQASKLPYSRWFKPVSISPVKIRKSKQCPPP